MAKPSNGIHVLNAHFLSPNAMNIKRDSAVFNDFLTGLSRYCELTRIENAVDLIKCGELQSSKPKIAFTFDDGYEECHSVIAPILEKHHCNAAFFVNANFVESNDGYREKYFQRVNCYTKMPMNWEQIIDLSNRGHIIGSHTLDHYNLATLSGKDLTDQIVSNKNVIEKRLRQECPFFAWPFGQRAHFSIEAWKVASEVHSVLFSGTDFRYYTSMNKTIVNRRHIEPYWPTNHQHYFLSKNKHSEDLNIWK